MLRCFERAFCFALPDRVNDARLIRQRGERLQAKVYAHLLCTQRQGSHWHICAGEADIVAICHPGDRDRLGSAFKWAGPARPTPPTVREAQETVVQDDFIAE